jgi:hypothetical protein
MNCETCSFTVTIKAELVVDSKFYAAPVFRYAFNRNKLVTSPINAVPNSEWTVKPESLLYTYAKQFENITCDEEFARNINKRYYHL